MNSTLDGYRALAPGLQSHQVQLLAPAATPMRLLSDLEKATMQVRTTGPSNYRRSIPDEAGARIFTWEERGELWLMSARDIARTFQYLFHPLATLAREPLRGFEILRHCDLLSRTGVVVTLATPDPGNPLRLHRVRLRDHVSDLQHAAVLARRA